MKLTYSRRQSGLALVAAIILCVCVLIIGGIVVKVLIRLAERINPPTPPPDSGTNLTVTATSGFAGITAPGVWQAPVLQFPALPAPSGQTASKPFGNARLDVERSTNLVDWEVIATVSEVTGDMDIMALDTNRPPDRAFYRGKFVYPPNP